MIIIPVILEGSNRKKDGSQSIRVTSALETTSAQRSTLDDMFQQHCIMYLREGDQPIDKEMEVELDAVEMDLNDNFKSPSKILRNVLYVRHREEGLTMPFKDYYKMEMERMINHHKNQIPK